ncbi:MAG: hypothetical protein AAGF31_00080 [Planctomycetota bacterium]
MPAEQVYDVLQCTRQLHADAADYFAHLAQRSHQQRAKMLLGYLSTHEQKLARTIDAVLEDAEDRVLRTWVQSTDGAVHLKDALEPEDATAPEASFDELVERGLQIDDAAVRLYEDLALRCEVPRLKGTFENILQIERQEEKQLARQTLRGMDL